MTTHHNDNARDGVNSSETSLTPTTVSSSFVLKKNIETLDGLVYAQPLYLSGVTMASGSGCPGVKNIVIVATENNSIYAFDVTPGSSTLYGQCWVAHLNASGENAIPFTDLTGSTPECNNIVPQEGITGTPVIDLGVKPPALYAASAVKTSSGWDFKLNIVKTDGGTVLNSSTLYLSARIQAQAGGTNFSPLYQNQRAGLALYRPTTGGKVNLYVGFGSHCDSTPYQGYVAGFQFVYGKTPTWNNLGVFASQNTPSGSQGGIWMSGGAPAIDTNGNVYVAVGNGDWNGSGNGSVPSHLGESVVQLVQSGSTLTAVDYYTPNSWNLLNQGSGLNSVCLAYGSGSCPSGKSVTLTKNDYDLGAGAVALINPLGSGYTSLCGTNGELMAGGKEGVLYGVCYNASGSTGGIMGGLDSCGYTFSSSCSSSGNLATVAAQTACTQSGTGSIAQCFNGIANPNGLDNGNRGTPAFWAGTASIPENYLYVAGIADVIKAYTFKTTGSFDTNFASDTSPHTYPYPGATPSVSWSGSDGGTGVVWAIDTNGAYGKYDVRTDTTTSAGAATLYGYTAVPLGGTIAKDISSDTIALLSGMTNYGPGAVKFAVPTIAGGLVFVAGGEANPNYYKPGKTTTSGANCTPSANGGSCLGALYIYGLN